MPDRRLREAQTAALKQLTEDRLAEMVARADPVDGRKASRASAGSGANGNGRTGGPKAANDLTGRTLRTARRSAGGTENVSLSPSRIFILRPVATTLLMAGIMLAGLVAYRQLPVSALPQVDYPTIQVLTFYPGAGPNVIVSSVTAPLERQFGQVPGLKQMTSTSTFGASLIILQFDLNQNIDVAEQQVQAAINAGGTFLPTDLPNPPIYSKVNPADAPILTLALELERHAAAQGRRPGGHHAGPEDFAASRSRAGDHQRRPKARGPRAGQSDVPWLPTA